MHIDDIKPVRLPCPLGDVGDNPLRTPENKEGILVDFAIGLSWRKVAKKYATSPEAIRKWMLADPEFKAQYLMAKEFAMDFKGEEIEEALALLDVIETYPATYPDDHPDEELRGKPHPKAGEPLPTEKDKPQRVRAKVEGVKVLMEKLAPKRFGTLVKLADADGEKLTIIAPRFDQLMTRPGDDAKVVDHIGDHE